MNKPFLLLMLLLCTILESNAQTALLTLDENSLTLINQDAITGLNIDKIGLDFSNRPCARLKIHVNRMTPEEIEGIQVKTIGGNVIVTSHKNIPEGNGIIVELTANPAVKIYLHHDKFGDSDPVTLKLEGNKEYRIEATGNQCYSVTVMSNKANAEVFWDDSYRGRLIDGNRLTIKNVFVGPHQLKFISGKEEISKEVFVSDSEIFFNLDFEDTAKSQNFIVFEGLPADAIVQIDGQPVQVNEGIAQKFMKAGRYNYEIKAKYYHSYSNVVEFDGKAKMIIPIMLKPAFGSLKLESSDLKEAIIYIDNELCGKAPLTIDKVSSGKHTLQIIKPLYKLYSQEFSIEDSQVINLKPELIPDFTEIQLYAEEGLQIWIDGECKGSTKWTGPLATGLHQIESRLPGHKPWVTSITVSKDMSEKTFVLKSPTPIYSSLSITSSPAKADVTIDGKPYGQTPIFLPEILIGKHVITFKTDTMESSEEIIVIENKPYELHSNLKKSFTKSEMRQTKRLNNQAEKKTGLMGNVSLDFGFNIGTQIIVGWRFNQHVSLGLGFGCTKQVNALRNKNFKLIAKDMIPCEPRNYQTNGDCYEIPRGNIGSLPNGDHFVCNLPTYFPVFVNLKCNYTKSKISPYIELNLGGAFASASRSSLYVDTTLIGVDFDIKKKYPISLGLVLGVMGNYTEYSTHRGLLGNPSYIYKDTGPAPRALLRLSFGF